MELIFLKGVLMTFLLFLLGCYSLRVVHNSNVNDYSRNVIRISREATLDMDVFLHEYAHYLDDNYIKSESDKVYFKSEVDKVLETNYETLRDKFLEEFEEKEAIQLQDIINASTRGAVKIKYGHDRLYWSFYGNNYKEIFADLFVIYYTKKEKEKEFINKNFGGLENSFKTILENNGIDI